MAGQMQRWELANREYRPNGTWEFVKRKGSPIATINWGSKPFFLEEDVSSMTVRPTTLEAPCFKELA